MPNGLGVNEALHAFVAYKLGLGQEAIFLIPFILRFSNISVNILNASFLTLFFLFKERKRSST
jgi:hypothetical protein